MGKKTTQISKETVKKYVRFDDLLMNAGALNEKTKQIIKKHNFNTSIGCD